MALHTAQVVRCVQRYSARTDPRRSRTAASSVHVQLAVSTLYSIHSASFELLGTSRPSADPRRVEGHVEAEMAIWMQVEWPGPPAAPLRSSQRAPKIEVLLVRRLHGPEPNVPSTAHFLFYEGM